MWGSCLPKRNSSRVVGLEPALHLIGRIKRWPLEKVTRSRERFEIAPALRSLIEVKRGVLDVLDIRGDAKAEDEHHDRRANESEGEPHGVAEDLHGLAVGVGQQPSEAERRDERDRQSGRRGRDLDLPPGLDPHLFRAGELSRLAGRVGDVLPWHRRSSYEPNAPARGVPQSPRWRVGLVCAKDAKLSCRGNKR